MCDKKNSVLFTNTECVFLSPDFKLLDESHVLLKVPRKDNMYSVDLKNIVPSGGKFDGKADEGFFVRYSTNSKAFRVFNNRTRIVEENLHVKFSEETPNIAGNGSNWLFDIDALKISMNYKSVIAGNQTNGNAGTKENIDVDQARKKIVSDQEYILLPLLTSNPSLFKSSKDSPNARFKPSREEEKIDSEHLKNKDSKVPNIEEPRVNQEQDANVNGTNNINTVSLTVSVADIENNAIDENIVYGCIDDPNMPNLEEIVYSDDDEEVGAEADMNNLATTVPTSPIPTTRVHKDHPLEQINGDIHSAPQTRRMTKNRSIGTKWVYRNKKDDRGIVVRNKARLVAQGYTQEEGIDYDEVFAPIARIKAIRLFLAYASFMNFIVYQMDVKSAFLYSTIEEEVYVCQPPGFEDLEFPNKVYKVEKALYGLHQAPRACNALGYSTFRCNPDLEVLQIGIRAKVIENQGADDEEISEGGILQVIVLGYNRLPIQPVAPPSPHYIPGLEDPQTPPVPQDEDEREPMFVQAHDPNYVPEHIYLEYIPLEDEHEFPAEEQPLPPVDSPTVELLRYVTESDPEEDPEEYEDDDTKDSPVDYPMDGGDDGDDDDGDSSKDDIDDEDEDDEDKEEEEEEHLAPANSAVIVPADELVSPPEGTKPVIPPPSTDITFRARITVRPQASISLLPEAEVERLLAMTTSSPSPPISLSPSFAGERLPRCMTPPAHSSPPPVPSPLLPSSRCPNPNQNSG
ncbi:putative ribonuclease H-like domain-containing protein [Tanacetum coccineum]